MRVLGLDISSASTGWAVLDDGLLTSRDNVGLIRFKPKQPHGERLGIFQVILAELLETHKPDLVAIEDLYLSFTNPKVSVILAYYHGAAKKVVWSLKGVEPMVETATNFRKLLGAKYGLNLLPGKKEKLATGKDSKMLTFELMQRVFGLDDWKFRADNDKTDGLATALAATLIQQSGGPVEALPPAPKPRSKRKSQDGDRPTKTGGSDRKRQRKPRKAGG